MDEWQSRAEAPQRSIGPSPSQGPTGRDYRAELDHTAPLSAAAHPCTTVVTQH